MQCEGKFDCWLHLIYAYASIPEFLSDNSHLTVLLFNMAYHVTAIMTLNAAPALFATSEFPLSPSPSATEWRWSIAITALFWLIAHLRPVVRHFVSRLAATAVAVGFAVMVA